MKMYEIGGLHDNTKYQFADLKSTIPMECTKTRVESSQLSHLQTGSFLLKTYPFHCLGVYSRKTPLRKEQAFYNQQNGGGHNSRANKVKDETGA